MDSVSETTVSEPAHNSRSWITAAVAVAGLIVIAVVIAATVTSNGKGAGFGPMTRAQDRAVRADLRNALTAEKTIYTDNQMYSSKIAEMRSIESSLDWGGHLHVVVDKSTCPLGHGSAVVDPLPINPPDSVEPGTDPAVIDPGIIVNGPDISFDTSCLGGNVVCLDETSTSGTTFSLGDVASGARAGTYYGTRACPAVATPEAVSSLGTSWDGTSSVSWGGDLEPAPDTDCQTEMDTFRTAIEAYKAMGPHPWPEGDAAAVRLTLIRAGLLMPDMPLSHNSATSPPKANTWYYDASTHWFTSRCDA